MKTILSHPWVTLVSRLVLGTVFIVASLDKIALPEAFAVSLYAYQLLPYALLNAIAIVLPWIELICGILLVAGVSIRANAAMLGTLLVVFLVAIGSAMARGLNIDCGCFGAAHATPVGWPKIIEDIGLMILAIQLYRYPVTAFSLGSNEETEPVEIPEAGSQFL